jgi:hypothetical protein
MESPDVLLRELLVGEVFQIKESPNAWTDPRSPPAGVLTHTPRPTTRPAT